MKQTLETFQFTDAAALRDWLNGFKETDLSVVNIVDNNGCDYLTVHWEEETLTDGSLVNNIVIN